MGRVSRKERRRFHKLLMECLDKLESEKNSEKPHWSTVDTRGLFNDLCGEILELNDELKKPEIDANLTVDECKDVINIALFIMDRYHD